MRLLSLALVRNLPFSNLKTGSFGSKEKDFNLEMAAMGQQPKCGKGNKDTTSPFFVLVFGILL
jgi:hypothetical protein